jgi:uncharacterized protein
VSSSAQHRSVFIAGPAGRLEGVFWTPARDNPTIASVMCHPHPLFGGTLHNKVVFQVARTLDRMGVPVLRFNFRGTGLSEGTHDGGAGEQDDVRAALDFVAKEFPGVPLLCAGFSFGCTVGLRVGCGDVRVSELIGLGAPVNNSDLSYLGTCEKPLLLVQGERDEFGSPAKLMELITTFPIAVRRNTKLVVVPEADHFFAERLDKVDAAIAQWLTARHPELKTK